MSGPVNQNWVRNFRPNVSVQSLNNNSVCVISACDKVQLPVKEVCVTKPVDVCDTVCEQVTDCHDNVVCDDWDDGHPDVCEEEEDDEDDHCDCDCGHDE
jgi:hypothetical protein